MRFSQRLRVPLRHPVATRLLVLVAFLLTAAQVVAPTTFHLAAGDLTVDTAPSIPGGKLSFELGPLGDLTWNTHKGPINIDARFVLAKKITGVPELSDAADLRWKMLARKAPWLVLAGLLLGMALTSNPGRPGFKAPLLGAIGVTSFAAGMVAISVLTFNPKALQHPQYRGPIENAPRVISLLQEAQGDLAGVTRNINKTIAGLERIQRQIVEQAAPPPTETAKLLLISDIHNNPLGLLIAKQLAEQFGVDGILDAGDFTDRGSPPEAELFARFATFSVPHIIVGGNHEDTAVLDRAARIPGVTVLDSAGSGPGKTDVATVADLTILGDSDPNSHSVSSDPFNETARLEIPEKCRRLEERLLEVRPQILMVHDPLQGECAATLAEESDIPLLFAWGHTHKEAYEERGSVTGVSAGTSGANGIKTGKTAPYGLVLIEFDRETNTLSSVCLFDFDGPSALRKTSCHISPVGASAKTQSAPRAFRTANPIE